MPPPVDEQHVLDEVLGAWRAGLDIQDVAPDDEFYARGGTSLAAAEIAAYLGETLGVTVPVAEILRGGTARSLASAIVQSWTAPRHSESRPAADPADQGPAPATVQQQAIWFLEELDGNNRAYNSVVAVTLDGRVRLDLLERALHAVVQRHAILRTTFPTRDTVLVQRVHPQGVVHLERVSPDPANPAAVPDLLGGLGRHRFDLATLPLVRWAVAGLGGDRHVLAQIEHHFVHDGWSMWILLTEIAEIYRSMAAGRAPELPALTSTYEAYGRWQRRWLASDEATAQRTWWTRLLADAPRVYRFPADERRPAYFTHEGGTVTARLPTLLRRQVAAAAARWAVTPFAVMMAAFAALLGSDGDVDALTLGSMLRNRRLPGTGHIVGMLVNTVALPIPAWRPLAFEALVRQVFTLLVGAQMHQEIPFPVVSRALRLPRQLTRNALFQVSFSMNDWPSQRLDFGPGLTASVSYPSNGGAKFDLDVVVDDPAQCTFLWRYYSALFSHGDVAALAARYEDVLARCLAGDHVRLGDLLAR